MMAESSIGVQPDSDARVSVSALICTRNRSSTLLGALQATAALQLDGVSTFELLIVDNGSADKTRNVVDDFAAKAPFPVRYLFEARAGLSYARNNGLSQARGDLIMFTDDDCRVAADWITTAVRFFGSDLLRIVGGRVELFDSDQPSTVIKSIAGSRDDGVGCSDFWLPARRQFGVRACRCGKNWHV